MINKYEAVGIFASIAFMTLALFLLRVETAPELTGNVDTDTQSASIAVVDESLQNESEALFGAITDSLSDQGEVQKLIVDDVVIGTGETAQKGDTVTVHYIGTLQNGQQFDSSYLRGEPFSFTLGGGKVIEGWEKGVLGMQVGGDRILVIPPEMGYGARAVGPIPGNSVLVFAVKLLEIN
ncbi:MAG: FKBP-type peptidyl-prolyl cis-trans isomerase [Acidimicrobiales bacterium]|jgi:FKBP-type peptidyl-prolyl cis-trans isomerase